MKDRIKAAVDVRRDGEFVDMVRIDAHAVEGFTATVDSAVCYLEAGVDMIFGEALTTLGTSASEIHMSIMNLRRN